MNGENGPLSLAREDTTELRHELHQTHKRIKRLARQQKTFEKNQRLMKETFKFRSNPFKYGRKVFSSKSTATPTFSAEEAEAFFPERFADTDRGYCYSPFSELPPSPSPEFNISSAPPTFDEYKKCSFRDEIHRLLVPTASPTLCGNVASVFISRFIPSFVASGLQLTFHRLGNAPPSDSSTNLAQPVIHQFFDQLPCLTAREKFSSRFSVRQSCDTCSETRI